MKVLAIPLWLLAMFALPMAALQKPKSQAITVPAGSALVLQVKGKVSVTPPQGAATGAQRGMALPAETMVETAKGSIVLLLSDGSQVLVKSNTRLALKSPDAVEGNFLQMLVGEILANIKKRLGETPPFRMGTPSVVITVRGTRFSVRVDKKGRTAVEVLEGIVEVEGLGEKPRAVLVRPGYRTQADPGRQPQTPELIDQLGLREPGFGAQAPGAGQPGAGQRPGGSPPAGSENKPEGPDN
jgi:hypothetical protein